MGSLLRCYVPGFSHALFTIDTLQNIHIYAYNILSRGLRERAFNIAAYIHMKTPKIGPFAIPLTGRRD